MDCQLVADVGNTETVFGLLDLSGDEVMETWRVSTRAPRTPAEYRVLLNALLAMQPVLGSTIRRGVIGSVVPSVTRTVADAMASVVDGAVFEVNATSELPIELDVEEPLTVGADRIVNTLAAKTRFGRDTVAVDLGTATTFDCITAEGVFRGGVIAPGLSAGLDWLARSTAKLPRVDLVPPEAVIGRRTETCIQSGVFYSAVDAVDGIVARIRASWRPENLLVVATGGFAPVIGPHAASVERVEPYLTLQGLGIAGAHLAGAG
ncbi:MAG: type III pantothenate kinase [Gemmatimonadetes bacterium]|nr:type III pantothenate kinase [Gemmatimonadota bacterium]MYE15790.1 type III pantothenate kinase [Gemmatimonadota bacterium]